MRENRGVWQAQQWTEKKASTDGDKSLNPHNWPESASNAAIPDNDLRTPKEAFAPGVQRPCTRAERESAELGPPARAGGDIGGRSETVFWRLKVQAEDQEKVVDGQQRPMKIVFSVNGSETPKYESYSSPTSSLGYWHHGFNSKCPKPVL
ncbi:hypothetical protein TNCV_5126381 [Trichonephila clavipes]|nr:hypothetical protein TNCV_5126381 [Trichonephila clavipes]